MDNLIPLWDVDNGHKKAEACECAYSRLSAKSKEAEIKKKEKIKRRRTEENGGK